MIFGYRSPDLNGPLLSQLFVVCSHVSIAFLTMSVLTWGDGQSFESWGELSGSAGAQLADLYPIMQKLPSSIAPNVSYTKHLHEVEKKLPVGHCMRKKRGLENGTGLVSTEAH